MKDPRDSILSGNLGCGGEKGVFDSRALIDERRSRDDARAARSHIGTRLKRNKGKMRKTNSEVAEPVCEKGGGGFIHRVGGFAMMN